MKIGALPSTQPKPRVSSVRKTPRVLSSETQVLEWSQHGAKSLELDEQTLKDLEIFESECSGKSLYDICNFTRTTGGANILKQRMQSPFSEAANIRATQKSIAFIQKNRDIFKLLPSYHTRNVEQYQREVLVMVMETGSLEFLLGAISLKLNHDRHYQNIVRGVQLTCGLIRALRSYLEQEELKLLSGELQPIYQEMKQLLVLPNIQIVPDKEIEGGWFWKVLHLDQIFRHHEKQTILRLLQLTYETDALVSLADATSKHGYVLPGLVEGDVKILASGLTHPHVENAIPNDVHLDQENRLLFLTGPNMAGKTTYLRATATALYFGHIGMGVPAKRFEFAPVDGLYSSISLADDLHTGVSYFRAEVLRIKAIASALAKGLRVVAIMDEPFKGTNVKDAFDASLAVLERLESKQDCLFMFSSHLIELEERFSSSTKIIRCHFEAQENEGQLKFDYLIHDGVSRQRLGMRVLTEENVFELLDQEGPYGKAPLE